MCCRPGARNRARPRTPVRAARGYSRRVAEGKGAKPDNPRLEHASRPFVDNPRRKTMASSPDPLPKPKPDTIEPQSPPERPVPTTPLADPAGQPTEIPDNPGDRKSVGWDKSVAVPVDYGGRLMMKKKKKI